jgi:CheY-like chemotaxis protein
MTLINDVLDFTKIETGNIELEKIPVDLRELVESVVNSMQFKAKGKNVYLTSQIDETLPQNIIADKTRICQILLNLVGNSVKFTDKGGITIDLKVIEETNNEVRIRFEVSDTGIGIAADKINTIFESFKQADANITRLYGGTGLGLAITKRLVELHDSRVNVESTYGQGSKFWFTITFNKSADALQTKTKAVEIGLKLNILVVDDNQINRLLIDKVLKKWGVTADFAENGIQALDKIESKGNYDVVLMDIHMPEMGGLEATKLLRAKDDTYSQQLPIIALTASMLNNQMGMIDDAGMNDYILKPFNPKDLYDKISKFSKE